MTSRLPISKTLIAMLALLGLSGCVTVASVGVNPLPVEKARSHKVAASDTRGYILGIPLGGPDYLDGIRSSLLEKCRGPITGLVSKQERITYVPLFYSQTRVTLSGYCGQTAAGGLPHGPRHLKKPKV